MSSTLILVTVGAVAFVIAAVLIIRKDTRRKTLRTQSVLLLIFGLCGAGRFGHWRDVVSARAADISAHQTGEWLGVALPYVIAAVIVVWWALDMDFDGLWHQVRAKMSGTSSSRAVAVPAGAGVGGGGGTATKLRMNKHKVRWYTPALGVLVMPSLAICPVVGRIPDGLRDGIVHLVRMLGGG